ncbi:MAG: NAD-dependent succinate-semialdehyde dehydrogenase [Alphaproteobacteria bacterium]|nr:NAD-dependent succinate-semialdehyde dehydrogenase [Alphaproteobacteria bacterium]
MSLNLTKTDLLCAHALIDGQWVKANDGQTFPVHNPATGEVIIDVANMAQAETEAAIRAAQKAQSAWAAQTAKQRASILRRWFDLLLTHQEDLAIIMTAEQGKPLAEAKAEIAYAAAYIEWFGEEAKRDYGTIIPSHRADAEILVMHQPIGVVAAITPWNFPAAMITRKAAPALAVGCTMILKPAEQTPLSALALAKLAQEAGVPDGVFNVVTGDARPIGKALTDSPIVRKLSFTGSTETGRLLLGQAAPTIKKVSMELGGNAPFIVFADADLEAAVAGAMASKFRNTGQTCVCANRIYVQANIYDAFVEKLSQAVAQLKLGNGMEKNITQGPLIDMAAVEKVKAHIKDATNKGAQIVAGGKPHKLGHGFFEPTILTHVTASMRVAREETFGPLAPIFSFTDEADLIAQANATEFGLAAYLFSRDIGRIWRVVKALEVGMVAVNSGLLSTEIAPFGGVKQSGIGREGSFMGIEDYIETKYVLMASLDK